MRRVETARRYQKVRKRRNQEISYQKEGKIRWRENVSERKDVKDKKCPRGFERGTFEGGTEERGIQRGYNRCKNH